MSYNLIITRTRLFGEQKNTGGMETYCCDFIHELSFLHTVTVIDGSGTFQVCDGSIKPISNGRSRVNPYISTLIVGFSAIVNLWKCGDKTQKIVYSFGYAGVILSLLKSIGFFKDVKLVVALFGLESVEFHKSSKRLFVRIQYLLGLRYFLGSNILIHSDAYLTEFDLHHEEYIKKYPFLEGRKYFCLPDPIQIPNPELTKNAISQRSIDLRERKVIKIISVGRDSISKRRDLSLKLFTTLRSYLLPHGFDTNFTICVPELSQKLLDLVGETYGVSIREGATDGELSALRKSSHFCLSTSNQMVPLLAVLEDMSHGVIPISTDDLGRCLSESNSVLVDNNEKWIARLLDLILNADNYEELAHLSYSASKRFGRTSFRDKLDAMVRDLYND